MLTIERQKAILGILEIEKSVKVDELMNVLLVSPATIRRDLKRLENDGLIIRSHGGAILSDSKGMETPLLMRESKNVKAKDEIALIAAELITENDVIMIDSSSTLLRLVPLLNNFSRLTVITHGLKTAMLLHNNNNIKVYCVGGEVVGNSLSMNGSHTCQRYADLNADACFVSCRGVSISRGVSEASEGEAAVKEQMLKSSKKRYLLFDQSKIDEQYLVRLCDTDYFDALISDCDPESEFSRDVINSGVELKLTRNS